MENAVKIILVIIAVVAALLFLGWLGFRIKPQPLPAFGSEAPAPKNVQLPAGLPAPPSPSSP